MEMLETDPYNTPPPSTHLLFAEQQNAQLTTPSPLLLPLPLPLSLQANEEHIPFWAQTPPFPNWEPNPEPGQEGYAEFLAQWNLQDTPVVSESEDLTDMEQYDTSDDEF